MFDEETTELLLKFLNKKAAAAEKEIEESGMISDDKVMPLLLKTQFNHIAHLDKELTMLRQLMDERFGLVEKRFLSLEQKFEYRFEKLDEKIDSKIGTQTTIMVSGMTLITGMIAILAFFGK
ncbi:MAG: hypothetical protein WC955_08595 [Elusimicrobiota bacterium]